MFFENNNSYWKLWLGLSSMHSDIAKLVFYNYE